MNLINPNEVRIGFEILSKPTYDNFIFFVRNELAPYMQNKFIEEDYYKEVWDDCWKHQHNEAQLPRGHSKTEMIGIWMTLYLAVCQPINPFSRRYVRRIREQGLIAGDGPSMNAWSERLKHFFYENPKLRLYIPEGVDRKEQNVNWNTKVMYLKNGHKITLRGIGDRAIRGNHWDRLHADDLVTENSDLVDAKIREKWDGAVDGTTTNKHAMVQITGTPLRFTDIMYHLKGKGYHFKRFPAIKNWETKEILSPNRWTWENLMATKERIGSVRFQCEYMLDPIDDSTSLIKREWIVKCLSDKFTTEMYRPKWVTAVYLGVDFAFSDRKTADKSVFFIIGEVNEGDEKYYVQLDYIVKQGMSGLDHMEFIEQLHSSYMFDLIGLEENSIKAITKNIKKDYGHLPIKRFWTGTHDEKEETEGDKEYTTVSKRNLILRMGTGFENAQIIIPHKTEEDKRKAEVLINECVSFAQEEGKVVEIGVHPDVPIGLAYAFEIAVRWSGGWII